MRRLRDLGRPSETGATGTVEPTFLAPGISWEATLSVLQANVFVADLALDLVYINPRAMQTLERLGPEFEQAFRMRISAARGGSIHRFHADPARVERILRDPGFRTHEARFTFGRVTLETQISQIVGADGAPVGYVVAWQDVSDAIAAQQRADVVAGQLGETLNRTQDISASVGGVSAAMEEMSISAAEIARNGTQAAETVSTAVGVVTEASHTMHDLGTASTQISEVAATIAKIADQTNLLALNATIEAARAGESGKGFAVVAGEVKELAGQTRTATERIAQLIQNVQRLSAAAEEAMGEISEAVARVNDGNASVAAAIEEQTATNAEITRTLASAAAQAHAATAEVAAFVDSHG